MKRPLQTSNTNLSEIRRILVLRSGSTNVVEKVLDQIHTEWPAASVEILCQEQVANHFHELVDLLKIHLYSKSTFELSGMNKEQLLSLQEQHFDLLVIVYSNDCGTGYSNVHTLASALKARHIRAFNRKGKWLNPADNSQEADKQDSRNREHITGLKDIHKGQRAFILGMGPSLSVADLDRLRGEITFACNKIFLAFDDTTWRPTYYSVIDLLVAQNNADIIKKLELKSIHCANLVALLGEREGVSYVRSLKNPGPEDNPDIQFSVDPCCGFFGGRTVLYFQIQLAFHMGVREIYLLGLDFNFDVPHNTAGKTAQGEKILVHSGEKNHFHPNYRAPGERWSMPNMEIQKKAFTRARDYFQMHGGKIINLSPNTRLDVFPHALLEDVLNEKYLAT